MDDIVPVISKHVPISRDSHVSARDSQLLVRSPASDPYSRELLDLCGPGVHVKKTRDSETRGQLIDSLMPRLNNNSDNRCADISIQYHFYCSLYFWLKDTMSHVLYFRNRKYTPTSKCM